MERRLYLEENSAYHSWEQLIADHLPIEHALTVRTVDRGIIMPARNASGINRCGVCDEKWHLVEEDTLQPGSVAPGVAKVDAAYQRAYGESEPEYIDEEVIFGGTFSGHFGHMILEGFTRLWYPFSESLGTRRIAVCVRAKKDYHDELLRLLDLDKRVLWITEPTQFKAVVIPAQASYAWGAGTGRGCYHAQQQSIPYEVMGDNARGTIRRALPTKVYLTRSRLKGRRQTHGEDYFEQYFTNHGFEVIAPEQLPIVEQIAIISHADEVVCTMGTLAHFALFCKRGARFTILLPYSSKLLPPQAWILKCRELDWALIDVAQSFLPDFSENKKVLEGPSLIGPTRAFTEYAADRFGVAIDEHLSLEARDYVHSWVSYATDHYWQTLEMTSYEWVEAAYRGIHRKSLPDTWLKDAALVEIHRRASIELKERCETFDNTQARRPKNILVYPYPKSTFEKDGIVWTDLGDGRVDAHGTALRDTEYTLTPIIGKATIRTHHRKYMMSLGVDGASRNTFYFSGHLGNKGGDSVLLRGLTLGPHNLGYRSAFVIDSAGYDYFGRLYIVIKAGAELEHVVFSPMITPLDRWDGRWEAYSPDFYS